MMKCHILKLDICLDFIEGCFFFVKESIMKVLYFVSTSDRYWICDDIHAIVTTSEEDRNIKKEIDNKKYKVIYNQCAICNKYDMLKSVALGLCKVFKYNDALIHLNIQKYTELYELDNNEELDDLDDPEKRFYGYEFNVVPDSWNSMFVESYSVKFSSSFFKFIERLVTECGLAFSYSEYCGKTKVRIMLPEKLEQF